MWDNNVLIPHTTLQQNLLPLKTTYSSSIILPQTAVETNFKVRTNLVGMFPKFNSNNKEDAYEPI